MARQWLSASGYGAIFLIPALLLLGTAMGKPWLAVGVVVFVFPIACAGCGALPSSAPEWRERVTTFLDRLPLAHPPVLAGSAFGSLHVSAGSAPTQGGVTLNRP